MMSTEMMATEPMDRQVLVIEDDDAMAAALRHGLESEGFRVTLAHDGPAGLAQASLPAARDGSPGPSPDLVILDVMLPKLNGLEICKRLRREGNGVPIIMLTARGQEIDKVVGLRLGADDYVTKPFSFMELMARVEAVLRRTEARRHSTRLASYRFGDVVVDFERYRARKGRRELSLSPLELHLLEYFCRHRGEVVSREALLDEVWGYDATPVTRTVDTHVAKLRKKIEDEPSSPQFLLTVHRVGYRFMG